MSKDERDIVGYCPMGCGRTLFRALGGHITCSLIGCPDPAAVDKLLDDPETEHVVEFRESDFTVRHPLRERIDGDLFDCQLHADIVALSGPPVRPGRYRACSSAFGWTWQPLNGEDSDGRA